ncbi:MAG: hypothetical protein OEY18_02435 [Candidatus Aminicenantes bacterium]|nr:hypothetical protein [Candidatus Aminicenantes bacterium]MDH5383540.1 hypothetical protein [Candidatus Aminicenantes bacterium]MDH5743013.1 hypothetical protein [Candidatus Aminicenantes bacterium]
MIKAKFKHVLLLNVLFCFITGGAGEKQNIEQATLREALKKIGEYCTRLKNGAYHFVCLEEISEKIDYSQDIQDEYIIEKNEYLYDYQLIKKNGLTKESRILLEKNGIKKHENDAQLETSVFRHKNVLMRTVELFSGFGEDFNDFRIIKEETLHGDEAIVIEAVPKASYGRMLPSGLQPTYLHGKIWVKKNDFSIIKIEWNPKVIKDFKNIEDLSKKYGAEPCITIISEYKYEKKGIRFPSRLFVEEAYTDRNGKKFIRSETDVIYKDYKFFIVETEIKY